MPRIINVYSADVDGSLFNSDYREGMAILPSMKEVAVKVILTNANFIEQVCIDAEAEKPDEVIILDGSARQSKRIDDRNFPGKGSCAPALRALSLHLQGKLKATPCRLDPYLLADSYAKVPAGENYAEILKDLALNESLVEQPEPNYPFGDWVFDDSKFTVLYAQMHRIAVLNPDAKINFRFSDDQLPLLGRLQNFFKQNPDLIPQNCVLSLNHYAGAEVKTIATIQGEGPIDYCYEQSLFSMLESIDVDPNADPESKEDVLMAFADSDEFDFKNGLDQFRARRAIELDRSKLAVDEIKAIVSARDAKPDPICFEDILSEDQAAKFNLEAPRAKQAVQFWARSPEEQQAKPNKCSLDEAKRHPGHEPCSRVSRITSGLQERELISISINTKVPKSQ